MTAYVFLRANSILRLSSCWQRHFDMANTKRLTFENVLKSLFFLVARINTLTNAYLCFRISVQLSMFKNIWPSSKRGNSICLKNM